MAMEVLRKYENWTSLPYLFARRGGDGLPLEPPLFDLPRMRGNCTHQLN